MNAIPIVCHAESDEIWEEFIQFNPKFSTLVHLNRNNVKHHFKQDSDVMSLVKETIGAGLAELKRISALKIRGKLSWFDKETKNLLAAVFVVQDCQIVSEYRKSVKNERMDLARIVIDPDQTGIELHTSVFSCDYKAKREFTQLKELKMAMHVKSGSQNVKIDVGLNETLSNHRYRKYFKLFCSSLYCIENILFFEEYLNFKEKKDWKIAGQILDVFFTQGLMFEINTKGSLVTEARLKVVHYDETAFDDIVNELKMELLCHLFRDFQESNLYSQMLEN
jgi:hypothetical protein